MEFEGIRDVSLGKGDKVIIFFGAGNISSVVRIGDETSVVITTGSDEGKVEGVMGPNNLLDNTINYV